MKQIAINACQELAKQIHYEGTEHLWPLADKIERRWSIQGYTLALVDAHKAEHRAYLKGISTTLDAKYPDRMSYLHR